MKIYVSCAPHTTINTITQAK